MSSDTLGELDFEVSQREIEELVEAYKEERNWEEREERLNQNALAIRELTESLVERSDGRIGKEEMSTLRRLCQVARVASPETKKAKVDALDIPEEDKESVKSHIDDGTGIVGGGQANIPIPDEHEDDTYQLLKAVVESEDQTELDAAVDRFAALDITRVQSGVLSPILYFLHPSIFPVINGASQKGMESLLTDDVSGDLRDYTEEAQKFRVFRDQFELGGEDGYLRDVDWFLYNVTAEPEFDTQVFQSPLNDSNDMRANFESTVRNDVPVNAVDKLTETEFDRETVRVWGGGRDAELAEPGDVILFGDRDANEYIVAATVLSYEKLSEAETREFCEAVDWTYAEQYRFLLFLDEVFQIDLSGEKFWEVVDMDGFPHDGFSRLHAERMEYLLEEYGSVEAFLDDITVEKLYPITAGESNDSNTTYHLWNTNYHNDGTDGSAAFKRGVAAAYAEEKWGEELVRPDKGGILIAYAPQIGVRGVGRVLEEKDPEPIDKDDPDVDPIRGPDVAEYHLPVDWTYTLPRKHAISPSETKDILGRDKMGRVDTTERPANQQGAKDLYHEVRERFIQLQESSAHSAHQHKDIQRLIENKKQVVFYGPPGTGKTYTARRFAEWLRAKKDANVPGADQIRTVTFHPSFSYEDFIEGLTAKVRDEQVAYEYDKGTFFEIVENARGAYERSDDTASAPPFILIVDEINRGNLAQIFGEMITLLEADKRLDQPNEITTKLAHSGKDFVIPPNLYVIGTMNTADESIALVDTALRRRFRFLSFPPCLEIVQEEYDALAKAGDPEVAIRVGGDAHTQLIAASVLAIEELNDRIIDLQHLGRGKQIGHTYLLGLETPQDIVDQWRFEILPQLEEYYFGQFDRLRNDLFDSDATDNEGVIDWDAKRIRSFDASTLYHALCDIAGIDEADRAELASLGSSPASTQAIESDGGDLWVEKKTPDSFRRRIADEFSDHELTIAEKLLDLGEELSYLDPGSGDKLATISAKSDAIHPNVGFYGVRDSGKLSFKWGWILGKDDSRITEELLKPTLERLEEIDAVEILWENEGSWADENGPVADDIPLSDLSEEDVEIIVEACRDLFKRLESDI